MQRHRAGLRSLAALAFGSLGRLLQDQLLQRQVRNRPAQPLVLLLHILHPPFLVGLQPTLFLAPAIIGLLADLNPAARLRSRRTLRQHDLNFTQLADNLFPLVLLEWPLSSLSWSRLS